MAGRRAQDPARGLRESETARSTLSSPGAGVPGAPNADLASAELAADGPNKLAPAVDLFGEPVDPRRGQVGRPRHMPSDPRRAKVAELHAAGFSHLEIAAALGITAPTLRLNYPAELNSRSQTWRRQLERDRERGLG